jgi:hypothetical protein
MPETAHLAMINGGLVVNVASVGPDRDYSQLKVDLAKQYDSVLEVPQAGIGWEEYKPGKLRMPAPSPDCVWKEKAQEWDCPAPPDPEEPTDGSD